MPNLNTATNILLGSSPVDKVYLGTEQVWPGASGAIWHRLTTVTTTGVNDVTLAFDELEALDSTHTLVAIVMFDDPITSIASTSWGTAMLDGSGNNGAALGLVAYVLQGDGTTNDFTIAFSTTQLYLKVVLMAFRGYGTLPTQGTASFASSVTTAMAGPIAATANSHTIAIAAVGLIGQSNGWLTGWDNGFTTVPGDSTIDRVSVGVQAFTTSGQTPSSTRTWTTARNARSMMWLIQGIKS